MRSPVHQPVCAAVSLEQMLERRDARVATQRTFLERFNQPLVQLTLVNPGPVKDTAQACFVFELGLTALHDALACAGHTVLAIEEAYLTTGPEALLAVNGEPLAIKSICMAMEDRHPLGRLWDVDVMGLEGRSVSRKQLDLPPRPCLVCDQPAHACARSGLHALADLQRAIQEKVNAYGNHSPT
jgi:holo-ACP synthase